MDHMFKVRFNKGEADLDVWVEIENDLLIALAKGKVDHEEITPKFFQNAEVYVTYHG